MTSGRPRTTCPSDKELKILGEDLVKWSTEETKELRCRFAQWYTKKGIIRDKWERIIQTPFFRMYYETAQAALAERFMDGSVSPSISHRLINHYVPESKQEEMFMLKYKSDLNKEETKEELKNLSDLKLQELAKEGKLEQK